MSVPLEKRVVTLEGKVEIVERKVGKIETSLEVGKVQMDNIQLNTERAEKTAGRIEVKQDRTQWLLVVALVGLAAWLIQQLISAQGG